MSVVSKLLKAGFKLDSKQDERGGRIRYIKGVNIKGLEQPHPRDVFELENGNLSKYLLEFSEDQKFWAHNYSVECPREFSEGDLLKFPDWLHKALEKLIAGKLTPFDIFIILSSLYDETTVAQARALYSHEKFMEIVTAIANFLISNGLKPYVYGFGMAHWTYRYYLMSCENRNVHITLRWLEPIGHGLHIVYRRPIAKNESHPFRPPIIFYERAIDCATISDLRSLLSDLFNDIKENNWQNLSKVEVKTSVEPPPRHFLSL